MNCEDEEDSMGEVFWIRICLPFTLSAVGSPSVEVGCCVDWPSCSSGTRAALPLYTILLLLVPIDLTLRKITPRVT